MIWLNKNWLKVILPVIIILVILVPQHQADAVGIFDLSFKGLAAEFSVWLLELVTKVIGWMAGVIKDFIDYQTQTGVYDITVVDGSWKIIRNFVNMLFILVLIIMAFGTIFNIGKYTYKDMLAPFIIAALLINFSLTIGQYIITVSNGLSTVFLNEIAKSGGLTENLAGGASIAKAVGSTPGLSSALDLADAAGSVVINLVANLLFLIIMLLTFIAIAIFSIVRLFALWFLLIISPIAWFGYTMPNLRAKTWVKWWEHFLCWCFFLPYFLFFMMFAILFIKNKNTFPPLGSAQIGSLAANDLLFYGLSLAFMIGGIYYGKKLACASGTYVGTAFGKIEAGVRKYAPGAGYVRAKYTGVKEGLAERGKEIQEKGILGIGGAQKERLRAAETRGWVAGVPGPGQVPGAREAAERARMVEIEKEAKRIQEQLLRTPLEQQKAFLKAEKTKGGLAGEAATLEYAKQGHSEFEDYVENAKKYGGENSVFMRQYRKNVGEAKWSNLFQSPDQQLDMARGEIKGSENLKELRRELFKDLATRNRIKNIDDYNMAKNLWSEVPLELKKFTESIKPEYMFIDKQKRQDAIRDFDPNNKKTGDRELMEKLAEFMKDKKEINSWDLRNKVLSIVGSDTLAGKNIVNEINKFNPTVNIEAEFRSTRSGDPNAPLSESDNNEIVDRLAEKLGSIDFPEIRKMHGDFWKNDLSARAVEKMVGDNAETFSQLMRDAPGQMRVAMKDLQEKMGGQQAQQQFPKPAPAPQERPRVIIPPPEIGTRDEESEEEREAGESIAQERERILRERGQKP